MRAIFGTFITTTILFGLAVCVGPRPAAAADLGLITKAPSSCSDIVFVCENGHHYPLCPIAVTVVGEVVTASLYTGHHSSTHVRMIPMGVGYRYAGHGIWLDGFRENALLNFGRHSQVACTIERS
jgi:hypothetical protein